MAGTAQRKIAQTRQDRSGRVRRDDDAEGVTRVCVHGPCGAARHPTKTPTPPWEVVALGPLAFESRMRGRSRITRKGDSKAFRSLDGSMKK